MLCQDLCSRISLDSASLFLFNNDVRSLSAGLPYPAGTPEAANYNSGHPSNAFAHAFAESQRQIAFRSYLGDVWPIAEITGDRTKENMRVVNNFIDPIIEAALNKKNETGKGVEKQVGETGELGGMSLLDHLVSMTQGKLFILALIYIALILSTTI